MRSVAAVVAGYLVFGISTAAMFALSGQDPLRPASVLFMIVSTLLGILAAVVGGWVAARLAPVHPRRHAAAVAVLLGAIALVSLVLHPAGSPVWSPVAALCLMAPAAYVGGRLSRK